MKKEMIISMSTKQEVSINLVELVEELLEREIGKSGCIYKKGDKFFRGIRPFRSFDPSRGYFPYQDEHRLTENQYKYILALQEILQYLNSCYMMFDDGSANIKDVRIGLVDE